MSSDYQTHMPADGLGIVPFRKAGGFSQALVQTRSQNDYNASIIGSINGISEPSSVGEGQLPIAGRQAHINVKRELGRWQIFFILISGTVGLGLFVDSGKILSIAGPWGGLLAFGLVGICVCCVMEALSEMIHYWPISNGIVEFVATFVDKDLGTILGFAYWCSWSITFATLINAAYDLGEYWDLKPMWNILLYNGLGPVIVLSTNLLSVNWYGTIEVFLGSLKIVLLIGVCASMLVVNVKDFHHPSIGMQYMNQGFRNDPLVAVNPAVAILVTIPITVHAFCGVEIATVAALEATDQERSMKWAPTRYIAQILLGGYFVTVFMLYLNAAWDDPLLRSFSDQNASAASIAMIVALNSRIPLLPGFLNACLVIIVLSSANTALYVASRSLYCLTKGLNPNGTFLERCLSKIAITNANGVPAFSVLFSGVIFGAWLPFIHATRQNRDQSLQHTLSRIATIIIVIVWMLQCIAFIRFREWLAMRQRFVRSSMPRFIKSLPINAKSNWLASIKSVAALLGLFFCLLSIAISSSFSLWGPGGSVNMEIAVFIGPAVLSLTWVILKMKSKSWMVELSSDNNVLQTEMDKLDSLVLRPRQYTERLGSSTPSPNYGTFEGRPSLYF